MKNSVVPRGTDSAKIISVIVTKSLIGAGIKEDPVRIIFQYWNFAGKLLASHDTVEDTIDEKKGGVICDRSTNGIANATEHL